MRGPRERISGSGGVDVCVDTPGRAGCAQPIVLSRGPRDPHDSGLQASLTERLDSGVVLKESLLGK